MYPLAEQVIGTALGAFLIVSLAGFAPTRLLVPGHLRPFAPLLMPGIGVGVLIVAASILDTYFLPIRDSAWELVGACLLADLLVLVAQRRASLPTEWRSVATAGLFVLGCLALGVAPLLHYGFPATIGANWDPEIYLPLADLIARYRIGSAIPITNNPVVRMLNDPFVRGGGWGFSYLQAAIDVVLGQPAHATFVVLVSLLTALQLAGAWVLFRTLDLSARQASFAAALLALNGLVLWIDYFGFGNQAVAFALLPVALVLSFSALDDRCWRSILLASIPVAGLLLTYYLPAISLLAPPLAVGLGRRLLQRRALRSTLLAVVALGGASMVLSNVGQIRMAEAFARKGINAPLSVGPGITRFVPLGVGLGTVDAVTWGRGLIHQLGPVYGNAADVALNVVAVLVVLVCGYAIYRRRRSDAGALGLGYVALLLYFWKVSPYPYGYFKALSLVAFATTLLFTAGLGEIVQTVGRLPRLSRPAGHLLGVLGAGLLLLVGINGLLVTRHYLASGPGLYSRPLVELAELRRIIPPGASVYVSSAGNMQGPAMGFISYVLIDQRVYGHLHTGYASYSRRCDCALPDYALYLKGVSPGPPYASYREVWHNDAFKLLKRPDGLAYSFFDARGSLLRDGDSYAVLIDPSASDSASASPTPSPRQRDYDIVLHVLSPGPTTLRATVGSATRELKIAPGVSSGIVLHAVALPGVLTLQIVAGGPVYVQSIDAWEPGHAVPVRTIDRDILFVRWTSVLNGPTVQTRMAYAALGAGQDLQPVVDVYGSTGQHYGWWSFNPAQADGVQPVDFRLNLLSKRGRVTVAGQPSGGSEVTPVADGTYEASLFLWRHGQVWQTIPLFRFTLAGGQVVRFQSQDGDFIAEVPGP